MFNVGDKDELIMGSTREETCMEESISGLKSLKIVLARGSKGRTYRSFGENKLTCFEGPADEDGEDDAEFVEEDWEAFGDAVLCRD